MTRTAVLAGRYRLQSLLAEGGMGEVWRARDELLERDVAVKLLRGSLARDGVVAERFRREARAAASLSHPNMANVFDYVEEDGRPGIVMELVEGETLAQAIAREAPIAPARAVGLAAQILDALGAAHAAGVVHRDVKPGNVIIDTQGQARVTDFGIARAVGESTLTETGTVVGSVHYVSPEQLHGAPPAPPSDLYGAGVILYEMLTGIRPFDADTPIATAMSRLTTDPVPPHAIRDGVPGALSAAVMRALRREPVARYSSASEMRSSLVAALTGRPPETAAPAPRTTHAPVRAEPTLTMPASDSTPTQVIRPRARRRAERDTSIATPARLRVLNPLWIAVVMGLLALAAFGLLGARSSKATVPNLAGKTLADAQRIASQDGFELSVHRQFDATHPRDQVFKVVSPPPGTVVAKGTTVNVLVSDGPPPCCAVPSVIGKTLRDAVDAIGKAGLRVAQDGITYRESDQTAGTVIDQNPKTGRLGPGSAVALVVSSGPARDGDDDKRKGKGRG